MAVVGEHAFPARQVAERRRLRGRLERERELLRLSVRPRNRFRPEDEAELPQELATGTADAGDPTAASLGTLLVGTVVLGLAAFSPFIVLKLIPVAEGALLAQGISRDSTFTQFMLQGKMSF